MTFKKIAFFGKIYLSVQFVMLFLVTGARVLGSTQSTPISLLVTKPDGTPCPCACLFGVEPGKTSFTHVGELLRIHPFTHQFKATLRDNVFIDGSMSIVLDRDVGSDQIARIALVTVARVVCGTLGLV